MCAAFGCGGTPPSVEGEASAVGAQPTRTLTTLERVQALRYPTVVRCDVARIRTHFPEMITNAERVGAGECAGHAMQSMNSFTTAVDVQGSIVAVLAMQSPTTEECLGELGEEMAHEATAEGLLIWTRRKPPSAELRELIQSLARESSPNESLCDAHVGSELIRHFTDSEHISAPRPGDSNPIEQLAWDFHFIDRWDGAWTIDDGSFDAHFDSPPHAQAASSSLRSAIDFAVTQITAFTSMSGSAEIETIGGLVSDFLSRTEIGDAHGLLTVRIPVTVAELTNIQRLLTQYFERVRVEGARVATHAALAQLSEGVQAWSVAHPRAGRRAVPFPIAPRTVEMTYSEAYVDGTGIRRNAAWSVQAWVDYGFQPVGDATAFEVTASGDNVTLHAYGDLDSDGQFSHFQRTGHREARDGTIRWDEITATDEAE